MKKAMESKVLRQNPQIDPQRVKRFEAYRQAMTKAGVDLTPRYRVASPLGDKNRSSPPDRRAERQHLVSFGAKD